MAVPSGGQARPADAVEILAVRPAEFQRFGKPLSRRGEALAEDLDLGDLGIADGIDVYGDDPKEAGKQGSKGRLRLLEIRDSGQRAHSDEVNPVVAGFDCVSPYGILGEFLGGPAPGEHSNLADQAPGSTGRLRRIRCVAAG